MIGSYPFSTSRARWTVFLGLALIVFLGACQSQPTPTAQPSPSPTARPLGTSTPRVTPTITALPSYTLEPVLDFSVPEDNFDSFDSFSEPAQSSAPEPRLNPGSTRATNTPRVNLPTGSALTNTPRPAAATTTPGGPTEERDYPVAHTITNITGHQQKYSLGCEAAAAVDWAAYFDVEIDEDEFQSLLPESDNPNKGFVGDVTGRWGQIPPNDYGVHADPVAEVLFNDYDLPATSYYGYTLEELKIEISQDRPVIAWVIGNVTTGQPVEYEDDEGDTAVVAPYEHVVIVVGYDESTGRIRYLNNGRTYDTNEETFLASWGVLENQVIIYEE